MTRNFSATPKKNKDTNRRKALRYVSSRKHSAIITIKQLLGQKKYIHAKVININSKGARISSKYQFLAKTAIIFNLKINEEKTWKVPAKVVQVYSPLEYGIMFDAIQHDLIKQVMRHEVDFAMA